MKNKHGYPEAFCLAVKNDPYDRFWSKVNKTKTCWEWTGALNHCGYGTFWFNNKTVHAHRLSWVIANNRHVPKGKLTLHKCDNPKCVRPDHLFIGTQRDNVYDCLNKNRRAKLFGESHGRSKFTSEQVNAIKIMRKDFGIGCQILADWTGVTKVAISSICRGKNWKYENNK